MSVSLKRLQELLGTWGPSFPFASRLPQGEQLLLLIIPSLIDCLTTGPRTTGQPALDPSQNQPFLSWLNCLGCPVRATDMAVSPQVCSVVQWIGYSSLSMARFASLWSQSNVILDGVLWSTLNVQGMPGFLLLAPWSKISSPSPSPDKKIHLTFCCYTTSKSIWFLYCILFSNHFSGGRRAHSYFRGLESHHRLYKCPMDPIGHSRELPHWPSSSRRRFLVVQEEGALCQLPVWTLRGSEASSGPWSTAVTSGQEQEVAVKLGLEGDRADPPKLQFFS